MDDRVAVTLSALAAVKLQAISGPVSVQVEQEYTSTSLVAPASRVDAVMESPQEMTPIGLHTPLPAGAVLSSSSPWGGSVLSSSSPWGGSVLSSSSPWGGSVLSSSSMAMGPPALSSSSPLGW